MEEAKKSIADLQEVVRGTQAQNDAQQVALDDISEHIERFQDDPEAHHHSLRERLDTAVSEFDAGHHQLMGAIQKAALALNVTGV